MTKKELLEAVQAVKIETKESLQILYDSLNKGQQAKVLKNPKIKKLFERYNISYEEGID